MHRVRELEGGKWSGNSGSADVNACELGGAAFTDSARPADPSTSDQSTRMARRAKKPLLGPSVSFRNLGTYFFDM